MRRCEHRGDGCYKRGDTQNTNSVNLCFHISCYYVSSKRRAFIALLDDVHCYDP